MIKTCCEQQTVFKPGLGFFFQTKDGMTQMIHDDKSYAMLDNYHTRVFYQDYISCETVDIPKPYFYMQYAMPVAKELPYFDALWYHLNALKVRED